MLSIKQANSHQPSVHAAYASTATVNLTDQKIETVMNRWQAAFKKIKSLNLHKKAQTPLLQKLGMVHLDPRFYSECLGSNPHHGCLSYRMFKVWRELYQSSYNFEDFLKTAVARSFEAEILKNRSEQRGEPFKRSEDFEIDFVKKQDLHLWRAQFAQNCLQDCNGRPLEGAFRFAIGLDGNIYVLNKDNPRMQHTSFFKASPLIAAGEIHTISEGKVVEINSYSVRFPSKTSHFEAALHIFKKHGFCFRKGNVELDFEPTAIRQSRFVYIWENETA